MKKISVLLLLAMILIKPTLACDLCGCSSGNYFIGPYPQFHKYFLGARYSFQRFSTLLADDNTQFSRDFYQTTELLAGATVKRFQFLLFVPYNNYHIESDEGISNHKGLGDITLMGSFNLLSKKYLNKDTETVFHQLWIGGGMKVPSGKFSVDTSELLSSANLQPGTGSLDFLVNANYIFQIRSYGFNVNASYKINQSAQGFRFGNRFNVSAFAFKSFHICEVTLSPNVGVLHETLGSNYSHKERVEETGGNALLIAVGFELRFKQMALGSNIQFPVSSDLSNGQTDAKARGMCHLSYMF
jgi:hypothetical protein